MLQRFPDDAVQQDEGEQIPLRARPEGRREHRSITTHEPTVSPDYTQCLSTLTRALANDSHQRAWPDATASMHTRLALAELDLVATSAASPNCDRLGAVKAELAPSCIAFVFPTLRPVQPESHAGEQQGDCGRGLSVGDH